MPIPVFTVCPLSVIRTVTSVGSESTAIFYSLFTACKTSHSSCVGSVSLCPLLSSAVCPLSVSTSHCTVHWFCVHSCLLQSVHWLSVPHIVPSVGSVSTAVFQSLSTVCQYLTLYRQLVLCLCPLLSSKVCSLSISTSYCKYRLLVVSLCPLLSSTVCPLSVSTSHCTICWFCVTVTTAVFHRLSTVCKNLTL